MSNLRRDYRLVDFLQRKAQKQIEAVDKQRATILAQDTLQQSPNVAEHQQVCVMVELRV